MIAVANDFSQRVKALHKQKHKPTLEQRKQEVNELVESFIETTGKRPDPKLLKSLADYLMFEVMTDNQKHWKQDEYPFHTTQQEFRRRKRQIPASDRQELH